MLKKYTLNHGPWTCQICPEFGMNVTSLRYNNRPIFREPQTDEALIEKPVLYGVPLLFPPNRTKDGTFSFGGNTHHLPITDQAHHNHLHGNVNSAPFEVVSRSARSITARLNNDGTYFPFPFQLTVTDQLSDDSYERIMEITNTGNSSMPVAFGLHTTFVEPEWVSIPLGKRWITDEHYIPTGEKRELTLTEDAYRSHFCPAGQCINGFYEAAGNTVYTDSFTYSAEGFDQWILFNGGGGTGYLCIEPQLGPVNALNTGGYRTLEMNESCRFCIRISK